MRPPWLGSARCWQAPAVNSPGGDCGGIRGRGIGGQAEAEGDVGGELDAGGVAVVAGLAGEIAGGYGVAEQFGVASGQVEGFFVVVVAEPVGFTTDPALWDQAVRLGNQVIWLQTYGATFSSPVLQSRFVTWGPPFCRLGLGDVDGFEPGVVVVPSGAGLVPAPPS